MATQWNFGKGLLDSEVANARQWASGKTWGDIQGKAGELGASADQLAQVFGVSGQQVGQYGYGQQPGTPGYGQYDKMVFNAADTWSDPRATATGGGGSGQNPYLSQMASDITRQYTQNLNENILPGVRYGYNAAGTPGSSRQGLAEGKAIGESNSGLASALTNLYGTDWTNQQNRDLQRYGIDTQANTAKYGVDTNAALTKQQLANQLLGINNQYDLGLRGDTTQRYGIDTGAATQRYTSDNSLQGQLAGASATTAAANASNSLGQQRLGFDMQKYNDTADWQPLMWANEIMKGWSGMNNDSTSSGSSNPFASGAGGAWTAAQLAKLLGY